jgi:hypothetical protein
MIAMRIPRDSHVRPPVALQHETATDAADGHAMPRLLLRAALMAAVLSSALVAAPAAHAARLTTSAATAAAERVAERYADANDADDHGVDSCERHGRRTIECDVFATIEVDAATVRECTATVTVRLGTRRRRATTTQTAWTCEDQAIDDDQFGDDAPVEDDDPVADDDSR